MPLEKQSIFQKKILVLHEVILPLNCFWPKAHDLKKQKQKNKPTFLWMWPKVIFQAELPESINKA